MYAYFIIHGGGAEIEKLKRDHPLMKTTFLQSAVSDFKRRVRLISKVSTDEKDERCLSTCTNISNRLEPMAISSRQAAIQGMPALTEDESIYIAQALFAMRGVNQKAHKQLHAEGKLQIFPKPFAYKGTSQSWMRNIKKPSEIADWTREPALPDGPIPTTKLLRSISCPDCKDFNALIITVYMSK